MNKYGEEIFENNVLIGYKFKENEGVLVKKKINKLEQEYNEVTVLELRDSVFIRNNVNELIKWTDTKIENGFIREIDQLKFYFKDDMVYKIEGEYHSLDFPVNDLEYNYNNKIGTLDFETYGENGIGNQEVYAGGFATKNKTHLFYINKDENNENVVKRIIDCIFEYEELNGYTFYAHNLGRFDSVFLIKSTLLLNDINIEPI